MFEFDFEVFIPTVSATVELVPNGDNFVKELVLGLVVLLPPPKDVPVVLALVDAPKPDDDDVPNAVGDTEELMPMGVLVLVLLLVALLL